MQIIKYEVLTLTGRRIRRLIEPVGQRSRWERCGLHPSGLARLGVSRDCRLGVRDHSSLASSQWVGSPWPRFPGKGPSSNSCGLLWANARHGTSCRRGPLLNGHVNLRPVTALEIVGPALGQMLGLWLRRVSAPAMPRRDTSCCRRPHRVACAAASRPRGSATPCAGGAVPPCRRAACTTGRAPENRTDVDWPRDVGAGDTSSLPRARGATKLVATQQRLAALSSPRTWGNPLTMRAMVAPDSPPTAATSSRTARSLRLPTRGRYPGRPVGNRCAMGT